MRFGNTYILEYKKFPIGNHIQKYNIDKEFFKHFDYSEIKNGKIEATLDFFLAKDIIRAKLILKGYVEVQCDICLDYFNYEIDKKIDLTFKFTNENFDEDLFDEIIYINVNEDKIDLKKIFYDYIILSLPIKKVHPLDENGNRTCNAEFLSKLEEYSKENIKKHIEGWEKLKNLYN